MVENILRNTRGFFCLFLVLVTSGLSAPAAAEPCNPDESKWASSRYYPAGATVFHNGHWYESREMHRGLEPGITFDWIKLDSVPDCHDRKQKVGQAGTTDDKGGTQSQTGKSKRGETASGMCVRPEQWLFSKDYEKGDLASHGGQIWEATGSTRGDMPDMAEPPRWELVEDHCALKGQ